MKNTVKCIFWLLILWYILAAVIEVASAQDVQVTLPIKAGITYICEGEPVPLGQCSGLTNDECCTYLKEVTPETDQEDTPMIVIE